jgi:hypothetical protein
MREKQVLAFINYDVSNGNNLTFTEIAKLTKYQPDHTQQFDVITEPKLFRKRQTFCVSLLQTNEQSNQNHSRLNFWEIKNNVPGNNYHLEHEQNKTTINSSLASVPDDYNVEITLKKMAKVLTPVITALEHGRFKIVA